MVRTKAGGGGGGGTYRKVVAARAPRKVLGSSSVNAGPPPPPAKREFAPCHQILQKMAPPLKKSSYDPSLMINCASPVLELVFVQLYIFLMPMFSCCTELNVGFLWNSPQI
ncbi:PCNA-associated factor isoform X2 [Struthio camelus]|uniref:PCNA-associated factor isoform X2 n=1 Tax=Struthio camelus TaxID=8801 RepID=UPI0036040DC3